MEQGQNPNGVSPKGAPAEPLPGVSPTSEAPTGGSVSGAEVPPVDPNSGMSPEEKKVFNEFKAKMEALFNGGDNEDCHDPNCPVHGGARDEKAEKFQKDVKVMIEKMSDVLRPLTADALKEGELMCAGMTVVPHIQAMKTSDKDTVHPYAAITLTVSFALKGDEVGCVAAGFLQKSMTAVAANFEKSFSRV